MKIEQGGTTLMDLVLCAVGCMLLFFIVQITQPRAPGRDDRPLVLSARAFALDSTQQIRFHWRLVGPDGRVVSPSHPPGASVQPGHQTTSGKQRLLVTLAEPAYGTWTFQVSVESESDNLDPVFHEAIANGPTAKNENPAWQPYFQALSAYRSVRAADTRIEDYRQFEELLKETDATAIATDDEAPHLAYRDPMLEFYIKYRMLCLKTGFLQRILSEKSRPGTEIEQARTSLSQVEDQIQHMLADLDKQAKRAKPRDDKFWPNQRLWIAIQADEESRKARASTPVGKTASMANRSRWDSLDDELSRIKPPLRAGGQDYRTSARYFAVRSDWIRWRGKFDYGIDIKPTRVRRDLLYEGLTFGRNDPFMRFVVEEFRVVLRRDNRVRVELGTAWGDTPWPARGPGSKELAHFDGLLQIRGADHGRPVAIAEITLEKGRDEPKVELSTLVQEIEENR